MSPERRTPAAPERYRIVVGLGEHDGALALRGLGRIAADGVEQYVGVKKTRAHPPRSCTSSRERRARALKAVMRARNSRSSRFRRSVSLSSAASSVRKCLTSADTDVSRSAAFMRARRYVSDRKSVV